MARVARGIIVIVPGPEWTTVPIALEAEDQRIPRAAVSSIRDEAEDLADKARARVKRVPVLGGPAGKTGLRRRVAAGVRVKPTRSGARVSTSMANKDEELIPRGLDRKIGWVHPVFGNRNVWVRQQPAVAGWFSDTMMDGRRSIQESLTDVLERSADNIDRAS